LLTIVGILVSGAGIGGAVLFIPIMIPVLDFPPEYATSSANPIIFGGSLAVTVNHPIINYNAVAIVEPVSWLGTIIGVIINGVIPDWLLYLCQFCLFAISAYMTIQKGVSDYRLRHGSVAVELEDVTLSSRLAKGDTIVDVLKPEEDPEKPAPAELPNEDSAVSVPGPPDSLNERAFNPWTMVIFAVVWAFFGVLPLLRGGRAADSLLGIPFCSTMYWILTFVPFPIYIAVSGVMIWMAQKYPIVGGKADLGGKQISYLVTIGLIAGVASGFLCIGGGVIKGPLLLNLGLENEEMVATSSFMMLLTTGITAIQFVARGTMQYTEFAICIALGFVTFLVGMNILKVVIAKTNNRSIIVYILGAAIGVGAILMSYLGIANVVYAVQNHQNMGFRPYCQ
jgi:uncharacterized membrane protein YfcA